jgi:hypothetical protein
MTVENAMVEYQSVKSWVPSLLWDLERMRPFEKVRVFEEEVERVGPRWLVGVDFVRSLEAKGDTKFVDEV